MYIFQWNTLDVRYNLNEQKSAQKYRKYLERLGYEYQQTDDGDNEHDFCDQYIRNGKSKYLNEAKSRSDSGGK